MVEPRYSSQLIRRGRSTIITPWSPFPKYVLQWQSMKITWDVDILHVEQVNLTDQFSYGLKEVLEQLKLIGWFVNYCILQLAFGCFPSVNLYFHQSWLSHHRVQIFVESKEGFIDKHRINIEEQTITEMLLLRVNLLVNTLVDKNWSSRQREREPKAWYCIVEVPMHSRYIVATQINLIYFVNPPLPWVTLHNIRSRPPSST